MTDDPQPAPARRGGPLPTEQADGGLWMIDLKHATKTDGSTGAGTPGDGIVHDATVPTVTEVPTVIMEPALYTSQPMNSGTDFVTRKMPVASPVMASGQSLGDQGGDVVLVPERPIPIHSDAMRANSAALTPSPDAEGRVRLRDPGLGVGDPGDPMFTLSATAPHAIAFDPATAQDHPAPDAPVTTPEDLLTHASFFSGVGGLDLGLERAGWRTVSFSEIDPYACAVLAHHWPNTPNLGSIIDVAARLRPDSGEPRTGEAAGDAVPGAQGRDRRGHRLGSGDHARPGVIVVRRYSIHTHDDIARRDPRYRLGRRRVSPADEVIVPTDIRPEGTDWTRALLWSGGFPCQDLSIAGKRRGMGSHDARAETRSGLAYAFLDLVEWYGGHTRRDHAILFENVPGLLSSNHGRDLGALLGRLGELGYGWAFRVVDAQHSGVPQRRRRVFVVALRRGGHPDAEGAAAVLAVGTRCERDHSAEREAWSRTPGRARRGADLAGTVLAREGKGVGHNFPDDHLIPVVSTGELASSLRTSDHLRGDGADILVTGTLSASMERGVHNGQDDHAGLIVPVHHRDAGPGGGERAGDQRGRDGAIASGSIGGLDPADGLPAGFIVATDHLARAVHTSTGRRSGPAGDEVAGLIVGDPTGGQADGGLRGHALPDGRRDVDARGEPDERSDRDGGGARQVDGSDVASTLRGFGHGWQGQHNSTNAVIVNSTGHGWWNDDTADGTAGTVRTDGKVDATLIVSQAPDARGDGEIDGMARRLDDRAGMEVPVEGLSAIAFTQNQRDEVRELNGLAGAVNASGGSHQTTYVAQQVEPEPLVHFRKSTRAASVDHDETWVPDDVTNTVNTFDIGDARTTELVAATLLAPGAEGGRRDKMPMTAGSVVGDEDDPLLPEGLDSHRYRCCGNGVVTPVAEWIGYRLAVWAKEALRDNPV